jgi:hypothetical protein
MEKFQATPVDFGDKCRDSAREAEPANVKLFANFP